MVLRIGGSRSRTVSMRSPASSDITASTDLVLAAVTEWGFKQFLSDHPEITYRLLQTLSRRLREAEDAQKSRG